MGEWGAGADGYRFSWGDGHPHCTDVETEAQAGEGKHSGSSTPSTRLALQCDM